MSVILIADDHPLYRDALRISLGARLPDSVILEAADMQSTLALLKETPDLDLLLLDLHMPGSDDLFGLLHIRKLHPEIPVAVVSGLEQVEIVSKVMDAGAMGFVPKITPAEEVVEAIKQMLLGETWVPERVAGQLGDSDEEFSALADKVATLTPSQYKVLCLLRDGLLNKQIGYQLGIAEKTVKTHVTSVLRKLDITNRTQAVLIANQLKLQAPE
ncbi:response regulator [Planctobacterium marinum]|uniref:response regulator n=1 Tax=Planctobacterium marinum TaxID=1631968 RepID=UPI001E622218|nr:response regulator transcription factor [Planctobacterium marinum]MCC2604795.1 response regulator transcription factor [Planctobacterium marinum]